MSDAEKIAQLERAVFSLIKTAENLQQQLDDARVSMKRLYSAGLVLEARVATLEAAATVADLPPALKH